MPLNGVVVRVAGEEFTVPGESGQVLTSAGSEAPPSFQSLSFDDFTGDSGSGGEAGLVPAPAAGDAAAGKFLKADGTWAIPPTGSGSPGEGSGVIVISMVIGDGTNVITTGAKGVASCPVACTITSWRILSTDPSITSGSIVVDVWKDTYANFPPTDADSITNGNEPEVSDDTQAEDTDLGNWTTTDVAAGDVFRVNVDSVTAFKQVTLQLVGAV